MHECNNEQGRNRGIEEAETGDLTGGRLNKRRAYTYICMCMRMCVYARVRVCVWIETALGDALPHFTF